MTGPVHLNRLRLQVEAAGSPTSSDWWRGAGFAYSILIPESRRSQFEEIQSMYPQYSDALEQGYEMDRSDLEGASTSSSTPTGPPAQSSSGPQSKGKQGSKRGKAPRSPQRGAPPQ